MNKQTVARIAVKAAVGFVVSAGIGYAIKGEKILGTRIDEYFATKAADITTN